MGPPIRFANDSAYPSSMERIVAGATLDADRLLVFVSVAQEGGFSAAARKLQRSQPAVSQAVASLESELGQRLFVREGRAISTTHAGRVLLEHAQRILDEMRRARQHVAALSTLHAGTLALGTSDTFACYLLPRVLAEFRRRHPRVELAIDTRPSPVVAARVASREIDVGVVALPIPSRERLQVEPLRPLHDVVIVPSDHVLARRKRVRLEDVAEHPLVLLDRSTATRAFLDAELERRDLAPKIAMETSSIEVIKRFVELGFGVSVVPAIALGEPESGLHPASPRLVVVALEGLRTARSVGIVTAAGESASPAVAAFVDTARRLLRR